MAWTMVLAFHQTELVCVRAYVFVYTHPGPCVHIWIRSFFFFPSFARVAGSGLE